MIMGFCYTSERRKKIPLLGSVEEFRKENQNKQRSCLAAEKFEKLEEKSFESEFSHYLGTKKTETLDWVNPKDKNQTSKNLLGC